MTVIQNQLLLVPAHHQAVAQVVQALARHHLLVQLALAVIILPSILAEIAREAYLIKKEVILPAGQRLIRVILPETLLLSPPRLDQIPAKFAK